MIRSMEERAASEELSRLLTEFGQAGGVVDFSLFELPPGELIALPHHKEAALGTIRAVERKRPDWQKRQGMESKLEPHFKFEPWRMSAKQIGLREFLGPRCDADLRTLKFMQSSSSETWVGYAYAFSAPPHSFHPQSRCQELFTAINDSIFGKLSKLDIMEWSTDWSNYFEPGREWWGSFCWTVYSPHLNHLVGIAASTTD